MFSAMRASRCLPFSFFPILALPAVPPISIPGAPTCRVSPLLLAPKDASPQQCALYSTTNSPPSNSPNPTFTYRLAASYVGKAQRFDPRRDTYTFDPHSPSARLTNTNKNTHKPPRPNSGQDAFFISSIGPTPQTSTVSFAIADGVGGWTESGIDPADFSHGLCRYMHQHSLSIPSNETYTLRPSDLLQKAYDDLSADPDVIAGGSTACVAVARSNGLLEVANLGDSGFVQLRPGKVHYSSDPQIHAFNTPYQLSLIPPAILAQSRAFGGEPLHDYPGDAAVSQHSVRHGDVLVFGSDGVWDNLSAADVLGLVGRGMVGFRGWSSGVEGGDKGDGGKSLGLGAEAAKDLDGLTEEGGIQGREKSLQAALAVMIAGEAKVTSEDSKRDGPFAREVQKYYPGEDWRGGKRDDICVVVAIVVQD